MRLRYPETRRVDVVDDLHGTPVPDPYRWLEDTGSAETAAWVKQQNELTESVLARMPMRGEIRAELGQLWDQPRLGVPFERGGRWFQLRNSGLQPQAVLYVMDAPTDPGRVLLDPNDLSDDGTVALTELTVTQDGRLLAYATSAAGSDWMTWHVRDVTTGADLPDVLEWSKFSNAAWTLDGRSFYYSVLDPPARERKHLAETRIPRIVRHNLGSSAAEDGLLFTAPDEPEWIPHLGTTDDGRFAIVTITRGTFPERQLRVFDLTHADPGEGTVIGDFTSHVDVVGNVGTTFFLLTDLDAPRRRVVAVDLERPDAASWREVVPERPDTLVAAWLLGGRVVAHYLHDAHSRLLVFAPDGADAGEIPLPGMCTVTAVTGHADDSRLLFGTAAFDAPNSLWQHDLDAGETTSLATPGQGADIVTEQVFVTTDDGTRLPVFLVHRRDIRPSGDVPTLLYGYGGFDIPMTPSFNPAHALWAQRGGLLVVACLRGGGEYGREWYDAGRLVNKQNVFDDFCSVARWLVDSGWSRAERIGIHGGSNGGLLVGACLTQRPELFGAAVAAVGVFDMLRFHLFTVGWAWTSDYGDVDDPEAAARLLGYSPLQNVRAGTAYPPTLLLTGDHDDRVAPGHSFKFTAALQAAQGGDAPVLIRVETDAGHGAGKPTQKLIDEGTDLLTFLEAALRV